MSSSIMIKILSNSCQKIVSNYLCLHFYQNFNKAKNRNYRRLKFMKLKSKRINRKNIQSNDKNKMLKDNNKLKLSNFDT